MRASYVVFALGLSACGGNASSGARSDASAPSPPPPDAARGDGTLEASACAFTGFGPPTVYSTAHQAWSLFMYSPAGGVPNWIAVEPGSFELFANRGDGTFALGSFQGAMTDFGGAVYADFDGDGLLDIAGLTSALPPDGSAANSGTLQIDKNIGGGAFASQLATYATPQESGSLAVGDFDRDGHPDIAMAGVTTVSRPGGANVVAAGLDLFLNDGQGSLRSPVVYDESGGSGIAQIVVADFDGDGASDIAFLPGGLFLNAGNGTFGAELPLPLRADDASTAFVQYWAVGDFNRDGKADLVAAAGVGNEIDVFLGLGAGSFAAPVTYMTGSNPSVVAVGDFNGDSYPDVVVLLDGVTESSSLGLHLNQGDGTFAPEVPLATVPNASTVDTADFNGDGVTDLAVANDGFNGDGGPMNTVTIVLSQCR